MRSDRIPSRPDLMLAGGSVGLGVGALCAGPVYCQYASGFCCIELGTVG